MKSSERELISNNSNNNFVYLNSIGAIFETLIILNNQKNTILQINEVNKIVLLKKTKKKTITLILSIVLLIFVIFFCVFFYNELSFYNLFFVCFFSIIISVSLFIIKDNKYKIVFFLEEDKIEMDIKKELKNQAKMFVAKVSKKLKMKNANLNIKIV